MKERTETMTDNRNSYFRQYNAVPENRQKAKARTAKSQAKRFIREFADKQELIELKTMINNKLGEK